MDKAEELQTAMAIIEVGFIDAITEHTEHKNPTILEPYDTFEIEGSDLIIFSEDEFDPVLAVMPEQKVVLLYNALSQACESLVNVDVFRMAKGEKYLGIDEKRKRVWGLLGVSKDDIRLISDRGAWGFFQGGDDKKYMFSYGSKTFVHYQLQID